MIDLLSVLLDLSTLTFAVTSMLSVGFSYTVREIVGPLRDVRAVIRALVANYVLVPLLAIGVLRVIPLAMPLAIGIFLIATAAGAPFLIKLVEAAEGRVPLSAALLVLLLPATIIYMPIVVPIALPQADVSAAGIATPLIFSMLVPLALGLLVRAHAERRASRLRPIMQTASTISLIVLVLSTLIVNWDGIVSIFGTGAILAAAIVIAGAFGIGFGIGFLLDGSDRERREVLGLGTGQRNIAAASVVATQVVDVPGTLSMVVVASLVGLIILFALAAVLRDKEDREQPRPGRRKAA